MVDGRDRMVERGDSIDEKPKREGDRGEWSNYRERGNGVGEQW